MRISDLIWGPQAKTKQLPTMSPQQQNILSQLLNALGMMNQPGGGYGEAMGLLQQYLNPESDVYKNFEAPYRREFEQQTVPMLAERFAGFGGGLGGGLSSSGFGQALGAAGANLQTNLAAMKSGMQRQATGDIMGQFNNLANLGLGQRPFENIYMAGQPGLAQYALSSPYLSQAMGAGASNLGGYLFG